MRARSAFEVSFSAMAIGFGLVSVAATAFSGAAFLVGRLTTGRYGYAVPAGILSGIGAYIILQETVAPRGLNSGGLFFLLFGLGFGLIYTTTRVFHLAHASSRAFASASRFWGLLGSPERMKP